MLKFGIKDLSWFTILILFMAGCGGGGTGGGTSATVRLECDTTDVEYNGSVTLSWSSTHADTCTASESWSGGRPTSGSETIDSLTGDCTFTLTCTDGAGGAVSDSVSVAVTINHMGTASLSWTPPTRNTDGSDLTDLAGYKIYLGASPGNYSDAIQVNAPGIDGFLVENLAEGTWHFAVSAFDTSGNESEKSNEESKRITP